MVEPQQDLRPEDPHPDVLAEHALPRRVEASVIAGMGNHTPGTYSDAYYLAEVREQNRVLAQICDGVTGGALDRRSLTGAWLARPLTEAAKAIDLGCMPEAEKLLCAIGAEYNGLCPYAELLTAEVVQQEFEHLKNLRLARVSPPYPIDDVNNALAAAPRETLQALSRSPFARILCSFALELEDLPKIFRAQFPESFPYLRPMSTVVGVIERADDYILYWSGDSRAGFFTENGFLKSALTSADTDSLGLNRCVSIRFDKISLPLSFLAVKKSELPPRTNIVLWSDGTYLDLWMEFVESKLQGQAVEAASLAGLIEDCRSAFADELRRQGREDRIDDHTLIVIPA